MTTALCIDMKDLLDTYFRVKYKAEVEFDGEYLHSGRDYSEVVIPHYEITSDPDGLVSSLHEIVLGSSEGD